MKARKLVAVAWAFLGSTVWCAVAGAAPLSYDSLSYISQGGTLSGASAYNWYYGCSPTSAGMMMAYYDRHGFGGLGYSNLVPGGSAELSSWGAGGSPLADAIIASPGYVTDFYSSSTGDRGISQFGVSGDDTAISHSFTSLGDFMGTSQDAYGNSNGSTKFYSWNDGTKFTAADALSYGVAGADGMFGLAEYFAYAGYTANFLDFYTQRTDNNVAGGGGFTFLDYRNVIDAGEVLMLQVTGHSMFAYGYDGSGNIYFHDTWDGLEHSMAWGTSYAGRSLLAVTVFEPSGGSVGDAVPEPATCFLLGTGLLGLGVVVRRRSGGT